MARSSEKQNPEDSNKASTESQTQQPQHTPKITTARQAKDHSAQKRRIEEKASKTHASPIQQPKPNTGLVTRSEIQSQKPDSISRTAQATEAEDEMVLDTDAFFTNGAFNMDYPQAYIEASSTREEAHTREEQALALEKKHRIRNQKRKEQRQNARRTHRHRTYKASKAPENKAAFTFPRQTMKGRQRNKREIPDGAALLADAEILSWLIGEYHTCEQYDYSWFFVEVMAQVNTLREMWPRRARSKSESEVSYFACREIGNGSIEMSTK